MLARLIPAQIKAEINSQPPRRLDASMNLDEMVSAFAMRIKDPNYHPRVIEHDDDAFDQ
jgi:hypothetical protein